MREPGSLDPGHYGGAFEYRYVGTVGSLRRDTVTVGVVVAFVVHWAKRVSVPVNV